MTGISTFSKAKRGLVSIGVWLAVPALFLLTIYSVWMDRAASAAIAGAFTLAFVIISQLPVVESFKIFTLEAKFARRLDEYEELLRHIRSTAEVSSLLLYRQIAGAGRLSSMDWSTKRDMVRDLDGLLDTLGIPATTRDKAKKPFLHIIYLDLFRVFEHTVGHRLRLYADRNASAINAYGGGRPIDANDLEYRRLLEERDRLTLPFNTTRDIMEDGRLDNMERITALLIEGVPLPQDDKNKLEVVRREVIDHAVSCRVAGTITAEAEDYIDMYSQRTDTRAKEIFPIGEIEA